MVLHLTSYLKIKHCKNEATFKRKSAQNDSGLHGTRTQHDDDRRLVLLI